MTAFTNLLDPFDIDRLSRAAGARFDAFSAHLDSLPQTAPCPRHSATSARLNREASFDANAPVYDCAECAEDRRKKRLVKRIIAAGIPADVRQASLANYDRDRPNVKTGEGYKTPEQFHAIATAFLAGAGRNVAFCGTPGIGKGHLGAALAIEMLKAGKSVAWVECARLFVEYHKAYSTNSTDDIISAYADAELLVLDELCLRDLPADGEEILFAILDRRHKAGRRTVLLGNKPAKAVAEWLGGRISDRLRSGGISFCFGEWDSMRGKDGDGAGEF